MINLEYKKESIKTSERINAENYFIEKYKKLGYECIKLNPRMCKGKFPISLKNKAIEEFLRTETYKGVPDLVVFNEKEFFFIEVKTQLDALHKSQIEWITSHPSIKIIVFYLEQEIRSYHIKKTISNNNESVVIKIDNTRDKQHSKNYLLLAKKLFLIAKDIQNKLYSKYDGNNRVISYIDKLGLFISMPPSLLSMLIFTLFFSKTNIWYDASESEITSIYIISGLALIFGGMLNVLFLKEIINKYYRSFLLKK